MNILKKLRDSKGFTLIELLVVIAIIGVLATLILLQLGTARAKARDAKRIADISQIRTAIELYFDDNAGGYPRLTLCPFNASEVCNASNATTSGNNLRPYFSAQTGLPRDPLTSANYGYAWNNNDNRPTQFHIWTELERSNAPAFNADADINSTTWTPAGVEVDGGLETCASGVGAADCVYDQGQN